MLFHVCWCLLKDLFRNVSYWSSVFRQIISKTTVVTVEDHHASQCGGGHSAQLSLNLSHPITKFVCVSSFLCCPSLPHTLYTLSGKGVYAEFPVGFNIDYLIMMIPVLDSITSKTFSPHLPYRAPSEFWKISIHLSHTHLVNLVYPCYTFFSPTVSFLGQNFAEFFKYWNSCQVQL